MLQTRSLHGPLHLEGTFPVTSETRQDRIEKHRVGPKLCNVSGRLKSLQSLCPLFGPCTAAHRQTACDCIKLAKQANLTQCSQHTLPAERSCGCCEADLQARSRLQFSHALSVLGRLYLSASTPPIANSRSTALVNGACRCTKCLLSMTEHWHRSWTQAVRGCTDGHEFGPATVPGVPKNSPRF